MSEKIMVVDDEPDLELLIRQKFRKQIKNEDWNFIFAQNGLEALTKLIEHPDIGLILSDINMPEMDGLTLLTKLYELKNPSLKTIIVSAYGDMDNIRTAMNRGAFDFVTKPVDFSDLETTIKKTLEELNILRLAQEEHDKLVSIQRDLNIARDIQLSILPKTFPPFPDRKEFDIFATMIAAKEVGGDFYDFFFIDNDRLGIVIGDVSGKGVPAAIFMAVSRTLIRATGLKGMLPDECLSYVNNLLCSESVSTMFVTVFYGILNTKTGEFVYASGGHNPPFLISGNKGVTMLEQPSGLVLGMIENIKFTSISINLKQGDIIFSYTDGVTEAFSKNDEMFTDERLKELLIRYSDKPLTELVQIIMNEVKQFSSGIPQSDDITILALHNNGN
jgi:phosphoserine phosphatase RsbU/P